MNRTVQSERMRNAKPRIKGIILDLDGTLVDSREAYLEAMKTAFAAIGQKIVDIRIATEIPKRLEQNLPIDDLLEGMNVKKFLTVYLRTYYQSTTTKSKLIPDASDALRELSQSAKLALVTMRHVPKSQVARQLEDLGIAQYFEIIVTALDTCNSKPSPEALIICAGKLGIDVSESAVVGDSVVDVRAGKNAGARTVAVLTGIFSREELERENPDLILESVSQLPDFLDLLLK